jgi:hypothetical protein
MQGDHPACTSFLAVHPPHVYLAAADRDSTQVTLCVMHVTHCTVQVVGALPVASLCWVSPM